MLQYTLQLYKDAFRGLSRDVWLLSAVMLINRTGAMVLPFLSIYLTTVLGFSLADAGWVLSAFGLGSIAGTFMGGWLTDRVGYYRVQFWSLLLSGVALLFLEHLHSFWGFCIGMFVVTMLADAFRPANFVALDAYSRPENRTRALALLRLAINLGFAAGPAIGGFIALLAGYEWLFRIDGATCIAAAFFLRAVLPEKPLQARAPQAELLGDAGEVPLSPYRNGKFLFFVLMVLLNGIVFMQFFSTLPVFLKQEAHLNEAHIGWLMAMNGLIIVLVEMPLIYVIEQRFKIFHLIMLGVLLTGLSYLVFVPFGAFLWVAVLSVLIVTVGEMLSLPFMTTVAMEVAPSSSKGQYMSLFAMGYSVSHVVAGNAGFQVVNAFGFDTLWYLMGGITLVSCAGLMAIRPRAL